MTMLSRVADSLYWMSRYLERAEHTARLLDVHFNMALETEHGDLQDKQVRRLLKSLDISRADTDPSDLLRQLTFDRQLEGSIVASITSARENARNVREQISSEMWMQINRLYLDVRQMDAEDVWYDQPHTFYMLVKEGSHLFQGITDATMNHNQGWHFIQIGRYLERITGSVTFLSAQLQVDETLRHDEIQSGLYFDLMALLKSVTAFEAYCKVYSADMIPEKIAEFLLFDPEFPRSVRFSLNSIISSLDALSSSTMRHKNQKVNRIAGRLQSNLNFDEIGEVLSGDFQSYLLNIKQQAYQIHDTLFDAYITYAIESALN